MKIIRHTAKTQDILANPGMCPLPLEAIPDHMGINLSSVEGVTWTERADGQLVSLTIHFIPEEPA